MWDGQRWLTSRATTPLKGPCHTSIVESLPKCSFVDWLSLWKCPLVNHLSESAPLVDWLSLQKFPLVNCLSKSAPLVDWLPLQNWRVVYRLSESAPFLSIVSPKINPCRLTVYSRSVPSSIKQQRSMCRKYRIWEQQKEHTSIQIKQSDFELYTFQSSTSIHALCCRASFFFFWSEVWFLIFRRNILFNDNLRVKIL